MSRGDYVDLLDGARDVAIQRQGQYGSVYKDNGKIYAALFPNGLTLKTEADFQRMAMFMSCVGKIGRYARNMESGGHLDSAVDLVNYAAMLAECTEK